MATSATANSLPTLLVKTAATVTSQELHHVYDVFEGNDNIDGVAGQIICFRLL